MNPTFSALLPYNFPPRKSSSTPVLSTLHRWAWYTLQDQARTFPLRKMTAALCPSWSQWDEDILAVLTEKDCWWLLHPLDSSPPSIEKNKQTNKKKVLEDFKRYCRGLQSTFRVLKELYIDRRSRELSRLWPSLWEHPAAHPELFPGAHSLWAHTPGRDMWQFPTPPAVPVTCHQQQGQWEQPLHSSSWGTAGPGPAVVGTSALSGGHKRGSRFSTSAFPFRITGRLRLP